MRAPRARARLARLRPHATRRRRQLLVRRLPGRPRRAARRAVGADAPVDLLGHSMGGNVVMLYAGVRPGRIRRLVNLEGFGMPRDQRRRRRRSASPMARRTEDAATAQAATPALDAVAKRLLKTNPRLRPSMRRGWRRTGPNGATMADGTSSATRRTSASTRRCTARTRCSKAGSASPRRCCGSKATRPTPIVGGATATRAAEFDARIALVKDLRRARLGSCGHMLHLDQPQALAQALEAFLDAG